MADSAFPCLVYLDHNVLDSMLKGRLRHIKNCFDGDRVVAVYSNVSLQEIAHSAGHETAFLDLLQAFGARYLVSLVDDEFVPTGKAEIRVVTPHEAYSSHLRTLDESPKGDFGLSAVLRKFYGGHGDVSYRELLARGRQEISDMLRQATEKSESAAEIHPAKREHLAVLMTDLQSQVEVAYATATEFIEAHSQQMSARAFEDGTGLRPLDLNNITGPDVVAQVWQRFKTAAPGCEVDLETLFHLKKTPWSSHADREPTVMEKVNAIYHALNFLGYFRDTDIEEERGFHRSFRDMTHAGMASFCHAFVTCDKRMAMKARAAYEYLNVGTRVEHLPPTEE